MPPESASAATAEADAGSSAVAGASGAEAEAAAEKAPAAEPTSGLLSNDLLDELGPNGGAAPATPPVGTPSEPATPCEGPARKGHTLQPSSLMSIDPWDWKTDAPEFVPGGMIFFSPQAMQPYMGGKGYGGNNGGGKGNGGSNLDHGGGNGTMPDGSGHCGGNGESAGCGAFYPASPAGTGPGPAGASLSPGLSLVAPSIWTVTAPGPGTQAVPWGAALVPVGSTAGVAGPACAVGSPTAMGGNGSVPAAAAAGNEAEVQQLKAHYEWQAQRQDEEMRVLQQRMGRLEQRRAEVKESWERERQSLVREIARYAAVLTRYAIPLEEACEGASPEQPWVPPSSLDAKMKRLNGLLLEDPPRKRFPGSTLATERAPTESAEATPNPMQAGSIASTLQAMFPHATIRTQTAEADGATAEPAAASPQAAGEKASAAAPPRDRASVALADPEVSRLAEDLEQLTKSQIDERALRALQSLAPADALEVLRKVGDLVDAQGGFCRNLSSILQAVCRKLERRSSFRGDRSASDGAFAGPEEQAAPPARRQEEAGAEAAGRRDRGRRGEESDGSEASGRHGSGRGGRGRRAESSEEEGSEEDAVPGRSRRGGSEEAAARSYWTDRRIERVAQRGFELKRRGDRWELKLAMGGLDPPLAEAGMERYCSWLRMRLSAFRDEHGSQPLRRCSGEVDFSSNSLNNQAVWMLLETLAQYEVHAACVKLYKNCISQGGILAMCEFIRANRRSGPVHEMHLSHNEIDDESALELLRTLHEQRPRYPPRRSMESAGGVAASMAPVPVWVRLNQNRIQDPTSALRTLESEGISYCNARNAHICGPGKCARPECPLVHLYLFVDQAPRRRDRDRERERERERDWDGHNRDVSPGGGVDGVAKRKHRKKTRFREQVDVGAPAARGTVVVHQ